jgi:16S rRNA (cytosine967-C5)-methyltransferase
MKDAARLAAVIDILDLIDEALEEGGLPADAIVTNYFRNRRYAGSKDRRAVSNRVYAVLREREQLDWALRQFDHEPTARLRVIANFIKYGLGTYDFLQQDEDPHAPEPLNESEEALVAELEEADWSAIDKDYITNVPQWLIPSFKSRFSEDWMHESEALCHRAPLDVRVNRLKGWRKKAQESLAKEGFDSEIAPMSPTGLRLQENKALQSSRAFVEGLIEIQDEAAQLASHLVAAKPGQQILDLCAGGGGKSLAVAGHMDNKGQIFATDTNARRLASFKERAKRADMHNLQTQELEEQGKERRKWLGRREGHMDRVIVDVPCSGTGVWRRSPDLRWRLSPESLQEFVAKQKSLINEAATCVKLDGRLIYMTCSLLVEENEAVVDEFLAANTNFKALDWRTVWADVMPDVSKPDSAALKQEYLQLTPARHKCDGFFVAILERTE